jgi:hypothetical protein
LTNSQSTLNVPSHVPVVPNNASFDVSNVLDTPITLNVLEVLCAHGVPFALEVPNMPNAFDMPYDKDVSNVPNVPHVHDMSNVPNVPYMPVLLDVPEVPNMSDVPDVPEMPKMTYMPRVSNNHEENDMGPNIALDELFNELDVTIASDVPNVQNANDVPYVQVVPNAHDVPIFSDVSDGFSMTDILEVADVIDVTNIPNVTDIHEVSNVNNVPYDSSTTSDILQVTIIGEGLKFHYYVDIEYDASDSLLLSTMSDDDSKNGIDKISSFFGDF